MPTALDIVKRSMRLMRTLAPDQNPTTQEATDGLNVLNSMLDSWSTERMMIYQIQQINNSWASGNANRTIGVGGNFNTTRPTKIYEEGNFFRDGSSSIDYPLTWLGDRDSYDRILLKSSTSTYPQFIFADMGYPLITLYVWPVPTQTLTLYLNTWKPLQSFTTLTTDLALPPGYQRAIEYNLAIEYAPEFGSAAQISDDVRRIATQSKASIRALNHPSLIARIDDALIGQGQPYNIYTDGTSVSN